VSASTCRRSATNGTPGRQLLSFAKHSLPLKCGATTLARHSSNADQTCKGENADIVVKWLFFVGQAEQSPGIATIFVSNNWIRARALKETTMATTQQSGSATIYQFPVRGRFATAVPQEQNATPQPAQTPFATVGGAWYHDEAIQSERLRKSN
jgi:hypothetical protein